MKRSFALRVGGIAALLIVISSISGCTPLQPIAAKLQDGELVFAICKDVKPTRIVVTEVPWVDRNDSAKNVDVWIATGSGSIGSGDKIQFGQPPSGFSDETAAISFKPKQSDISISLVDVDEFGTVHASYSGVFDGRSLSEDSWLNQNGDLVIKPCG
jgi:hypothetical protein